MLLKPSETTAVASITCCPNIAVHHAEGLSVKGFLTIQTILRVSEEGFREIGPVARALSEIEGLDGHARSIAIQMNSFMGPSGL